MIKNRASFYSDDLVVFLSPTEADLRCIRAILDLFVDASGLVTNMDKCLISPIRCSDTDMIARSGGIPGTACPLSVHVPGNTANSAEASSSR